VNKRKTAVRTGVVTIGAAAIAATAWIALPAEAATTGLVQIVGARNVVSFTAAPGKANIVVLTSQNGKVIVDDVYGMKAGPGCAQVGSDVTKFECYASTPVIWIRADLGDGNDTLINNSGIGMTAWGRAGNDKITGGPLKDDMYGGDGNDSLWGLGGNDVLRGENGDDALSGGDGDDTFADGAGNDRAYGGNGDDWFITQSGNDYFDGGPGDDEFGQATDYPAGTDADVFIGGPGIDAVDYAGRTKPVTADPDGVAQDDGSAGEKDTISSTVEVLGGGSGADRLIGTDRNEAFFGGPGNDVIAAGGGDDLLFGEDGNDYLNGAAGTDDCSDAMPGDTVLSCEGWSISSSSLRLHHRRS
jgi:Ca2+-binding RTX toxin-like protein